jgi:alcohol dehydrogenase, propanol-preferring
MISQSLVEYASPLQETESPTPVPTGTQVLLATLRCGVCHSDLHIQDGYFDIGGGKQLDVRDGRDLPFTLGHEIEGEVVAVGPDAAGVGIGDRVVAFPWIGCGDCPICRRGDENLCNDNRGMVLGVNAQGGFADHVMVPHPRYLLDYQGIPSGLAGTYMCSGLTAYSALKKIGTVGEDDPVLIVGLGGVGMMGLQFARALFGRYPLGADVDANKLEAAKRAGAAAVYNAADREDGRKLVADTGGGVYAAVDFVGSESSFAFANRAVRKGGKVIVVGLFGGAMSMPLPMISMRSISIVGSFVGNLQEAGEMMALVKAGKVAPIPIEERPMREASRTLDDLRAGHIVGRVVLKP